MKLWRLEKISKRKKEAELEKKYNDVSICDVNTKTFWIKYFSPSVLFSWREIWFSTYHQKHFDNNWLANWCSIQWVWENDKNTSKHPFSHIPFFRFSAHSGETVKTTKYKCDYAVFKVFSYVSSFNFSKFFCFKQLINYSIN